MFTLNCKGKLISFANPVVMGILNITPDSFYEGSRTQGENELIARVEKMVSEGVDILDIGGQSTRPGSKRISSEEELKRILPAIEMITSKFPDVIISVDTYYSQVARQAVHAGSSIVNDVSAGNMDKEMISTVAGLKVPFICMHMKGDPENMHLDPVYDNVAKEVLDFFIIKIEECKRAGIHDIIIDPGFGFGKNIAQNFEMLRSLAVLKILDKPIMAGLSRKSTIYKTLGVTAEEALNGTTALNMVALMNGAHILRVHDVREAKETIKLFQKLSAIGV